VAWAYTAYFFSQPGQPFRFDEENLRRVALWGLTMPLTAFLVGHLNRRAARALAEGEVAALRQARLGDRALPAQALGRQARLNDAMFRQAITGFVLLDRDFRFIRVNEAFAGHFRKRAEEFVGRKYFDVIPYDGLTDTTAEALLREVLRAKQPIRSV